MKDIIDRSIGLIETLILTGAITFGGHWTLTKIHTLVRSEAVKALKKPGPSLTEYTSKLTK